MCFGSWRATREKTRQVVRPAGKFEATKLARTETLLKELSHGFAPHAKDVKHRIESLEGARHAFLNSSLKAMQAPLPGGAGGQFQPDQEGRDGSNSADEAVLGPLKDWLNDYHKAKQQVGIVKKLALETDSYRHDVASLHIKMGKQKARTVTQTSKAEADLTSTQEALARMEQKMGDKTKAFESEEEAAFQMLTFLVQGAASLKMTLSEYTRKQVREQGKSDAFLGHMEPSNSPVSTPAPVAIPAPAQHHPHAPSIQASLMAGSGQAEGPQAFSREARPEGLAPSTPATVKPSHPHVPVPPPFPEVAQQQQQQQQQQNVNPNEGPARQSSNPFHSSGQPSREAALPDAPRTNKNAALKRTSPAPRQGQSDRERELATNPFLNKEAAGDSRPEAPRTPAPSAGAWPQVDAV